MHIGDAETEAARWQKLEKQRDAARGRLLVVATGHPRRRVRRLAREADVKLANAFGASFYRIEDMLRKRDNPEWMEHARKVHAEAEMALFELVKANFARGPFRRRCSRRGRPEVRDRTDLRSTQAAERAGSPARP